MAALLRGRGQLTRREYAAARQQAEALIGQAPEAVAPRVLLSHVLLQEGQDALAAEQALQAILALDSQHAEARQNLAVLRRQQQGWPAARS